MEKLLEVYFDKTIFRANNNYRLYKKALDSKLWVIHSIIPPNSWIKRLSGLVHETSRKSGKLFYIDPDIEMQIALHDQYLRNKKALKKQKRIAKKLARSRSTKKNKK